MGLHILFRSLNRLPLSFHGVRNFSTRQNSIYYTCRLLKQFRKLYYIICWLRLYSTALYRTEITSGTPLFEGLLGDPGRERREPHTLPAVAETLMGKRYSPGRLCSLVKGLTVWKPEKRSAGHLSGVRTADGYAVGFPGLHVGLRVWRSEFHCRLLQLLFLMMMPPAFSVCMLFSQRGSS